MKLWNTFDSMIFDSNDIYLGTALDSAEAERIANHHNKEVKDKWDDQNFASRLAREPIPPYETTKQA